MKAFLIYKPNANRAGIVGHYFSESLRKSGWEITTNENEADMVAMYGMAPGHKKVYDRAREQNKPAIIFDMGYWSRGSATTDSAHYKVSYNHWHPTKYILDGDYSSERFKRSGLKIEPWKTNQNHILLAGMGPKSCVLYGIPNGSWDTWAVQEIRKYTDRKIIYRPKPSWRDAPPIPGTTYSSRHEHLNDAMNQAHCVVTHHSNVVCDALLKGIPSFSWDGAARDLTSQDLSQIETPTYPDNRVRFFNNLAYCNWSVGEMASGKCWKFMRKYLKNESVHRLGSP